ncbi:hypothetical protein [Bryobacter aggregatus]|uniref:hypothetical protein n=1 Tax=Bryobacter aggregatus TaxID=360054 RepID=UPI0012BA5FAA|nr:hypothetical protein [Bryobacter aggregatus]
MDLFKYLRDQHRARVVDHQLEDLPGQMVWLAERRFGPPTEIVHGTTGRQLYIWKVLSLPGIPTGSGLMVVTLTIAANGAVTDTHWQQRGND